MTTDTMSSWARWVGLTSLAFAVACSGSDPSSSSTHDLLTAGQKDLNAEESGTDDDDDDDAEADDEGGADKIYCSVDADCDSDEVCTAGLCTGIDGEDDDDDDGAEADDDADEDDAGGDKIDCSSDADCDSDETCVSGKCT